MEGIAAMTPIAESTDRFTAAVRGLREDQVGGQSLVPPWTRGHVVTHVARAADSLCRLLRWAHTGVETPQYPSMAARAAEIEAGAARPVAELVEDLTRSAADFERAVRSLPDAAWTAQVRPRTGELRTPQSLVPMRLRELEVHHVDLDVGYTFADMPVEAARWIVDDVVAALARRETGVPALRIEATDADVVHELGPRPPATTSAGSVPVVAGTLADVLGWLTGRTPGTGLRASGGREVPAAPYWI